MARAADSLPKTVLALGLVSLLADLSSEMVYPLLPRYLAEVLGVGLVSLGLIEGVAEATASLVKLVSGAWSDRLRRRKPLVVAGYALAGAARPLIGLARVWPVVLGLRFVDRLGKGLRGSPRDALIADVTPPALRGSAFGVQRAMDHAGAVLGPLVAAALLSIEGVTLSEVFLWTAVPSVAVIVVLVLAVRERDRAPAGRPAPGARPSLEGGLGALPPGLKRLLLAFLVFTLGNSTDAFLLLRLGQVGVEARWVAVLWAAQHAVKMVAAFLGGRLSDRVGRRWLVAGGWALYGGVYLCFAAAGSPAVLVAVFLAYGLYHGLTEPAEKAWVVDLAPAALKGTALGAYHGAIGLAALPASLLFGLLWKAFGPATAFLTGAALALAASLLLARVPARRLAT